MKTGAAFISLLAASLLAAFIGLGLSFQNFITPLASFGQIEGVYPDRWTSGQAKIWFPNLARRGNYLQLQFDVARAGGPAHVEVSVCGNKAALYVVSEEMNGARIALRGGCNPREVNIKVLNPLVAPGGDARTLGAKLLFARVSSYFGIPIISWALVYKVWFLLFVLSLVWFYVLKSVRLAKLTPVLMLFAALILAAAPNLNLERVFWCWVIALAVGLGAWLAVRVRPWLQINAAVPSASPALALVGVGAIVVMGAALRFYGLDFGLPANFHPDEPSKVQVLWRMYQEGTLNPRYFLHPSLLLYLSYGVNLVLQAAGVSGSWTETALLAGRIVSAAAGTLSVFLTYLIGRRLYSEVTGLGAALCFAVFPLHVTCSRYMKEDALLVCLVLTTLTFLLKAVQEDKAWAFLGAGLMAGVTASAKYSGLLCVGLVLLAPWLRSRALLPNARFLKFVPLILILAGLGFVLCTPYSIFDSPKFLHDFGDERAHMERGHTFLVDPWAEFWVYHFSRSIWYGVTPFNAVLSSIAAGFLLYRRRIEDVFLVALVLFFYLPAEWVKAKPEPQPERYILPCLPFLALLGAEFAFSLKHRVFSLVLLVVMLVLPLQRSLALAAELKPDTREIMAGWIGQHVPGSETICADWKPYGPVFNDLGRKVVYLEQEEAMNMLSVTRLRSLGCNYLVLSSLWYERFYRWNTGAAPVMRQRIRQAIASLKALHEISPKSGTYGFHNPTLKIFSVPPQ
jgi:4-amino-4-deoxy-L-arabinose transferase-like glycosyltransferase